MGLHGLVAVSGISVFEFYRRIKGLGLSSTDVIAFQLVTLPNLTALFGYIVIYVKFMPDRLTSFCSAVAFLPRISATKGERPLPIKKWTSKSFNK